MRSARGFTLIELMITVAIIAILASVALPSYLEHVQRGRIAEATSVLADLKVRMEQGYANTRSYKNHGFCTTPPSVDNWTISCNASSDTTFSLTATGVGGAAGFSYSIDQDGAKTSTTGWTTGSQTCWILKKGASC